MSDFTLPSTAAPATFNKARFEAAGIAWVDANDHTFVEPVDYSNLDWTSGIESASDIFKTSKISLPATTKAGLKLLDRANMWSSKNGVNVRVNGMARPQAVQDYMREQPQMMGVAAKSSSHKIGAIDFDYVRNNDGSVDQVKTNEFKNYLKTFYKILDHANHIHVSP